MEPKSKLKIKVTFPKLFESEWFYTSCSKFYYAYFEEIPSVKEICGTDFNKAKRWLEKKFEGKICNVHTKESFDTRAKLPKKKSVLYVMENKVAIDLQFNDITILYTQETEEKIMLLIEEIRKEAKSASKRSSRSYGFLRENVD